MRSVPLDIEIWLAHYGITSRPDGANDRDGFTQELLGRMEEQRQQGAQDERRAIVELLKTSYGVYLNEDMRVSADAIDRAIVMILARGQQPPHTEDDLSSLERERLGIITQLEYRWSMAGGAKRDGLAEAIVVVKSRNLQPPSEGS